MQVSIVLPILNEAEQVSNRLQALTELLKRAAANTYEIIVVDGGSEDNSAELACEFADQVINSARGRALQMNAGAAMARGDVLLFLHADTLLPERALDFINSKVPAWGWFNVRLSGENMLFRIIETMMNLRSRLSRVATGDQAMFVRRELFNTIGGFPQIALMEDIALSKLLRKQARPTIISQPVITSSRRWQQHGIIKTVLLMWWLRLLYFMGVSPARLVRSYY